MTRCGMPARFPRTGSACWKETSPKRSFRGFWEKHGPGSCSVTNTSRWMEHCWKLGRRTKASGQSILWARITTRSRNHRRHGGTRITPRSTIAERNALIRHTVPPPIRKPCWPARDQERKRRRLRVDEDGRDAAPTTPSRVRASGLGVHFGGCDVQLSAHADTDAEVCLKSAQRPELHVSWRNQNKYPTRTDQRISHEES